MFCNSCGSPVFANQAVCGKCGTPVLGQTMISRVQRHLKMLGILWIAYAVFHGIGGGVLLIVANTIFGRHSHTENTAFLHPLLGGIAVFILVKAVLSVIGGIGLLERQSWGRLLILVLAIISLIDVPFGTALGVYTLWVLLSPQADTDYERLSASA